MRNFINYFIKYPIWPNVIKIMVLLFGIMGVMTIRSSFFPELENRNISINIIYPGASPVEIEKGVIQKIEDNLKGTLGIERYTSQSRENTASMTIEVLKGFDVDEVLQDVKNAVNRISSFPAGMEPPVISKQPSIEFAVNFTITGTQDLKSLKTIAEKAEDDLRNTDGISQVMVSGYPLEEIIISVDEEMLRAYSLTIDQVARAVRSANIDLSAGSVKTQEEEIILRLEAKEYYAENLLDIIIKTDPAGKIVRLKDIADVENKWQENPQTTYLNNQRAVLVTINKILGEDIILIKEKVYDYVDKFNKTYPQFKASIIDDATINLVERLNMLISNGIQGAFLVLLVLALFLRFRLAFWVSIGLPFSFLGMFLLLNLSGLTINVISLFGCIIVVGILVDDGIVIAEQIYQNHENGKKPYDAALSGVQNVLPSVFFGVMTTIAAFMPFFFISGRQGDFMKDMAFVVVITLLFSLIESAFILPSHLAHSNAMRKKKSSNFRKKFDKIMLYPRDKWFASSLKFFLKHKFIMPIMAFGLTLITVGAIQGGIIQFTFFPYLDSDSFEISLQLPAGTREEITKEILERIEKATWEVNEELKEERPDKRDVVLHVMQNLAKGASGIYGAVNEGGSNMGTVRVVLLSSEYRDMDSYLIVNRIRDKVGPVYEAESIAFGQGSRFGKPISIPLISPSLDDIQNVKQALKDSLNSISELRDVSDNDPEGLREIKITLKDKAFMLGLSNFEIARQIRQGFFGEEVQRVQRGSDEVKIWVKYTETGRSTIGKWEDMRIRTAGGAEYPMSELVDYEIVRGKSVVNHLDGKRQITVEADMIDQNAPVPPILNRVKDDILPKILEFYPSVSTVESGQQREIMKTGRTAQVPMTVALIIMFFLIVLSFRSFSQAVIVVMMIPLGLIGAMWGHVVHGMPVNMMSAYGVLALIGIIVNNSIVFVNTFNQNVAEGMEHEQSVFNAALNRFRPILLTTITTVAGLFPLLSAESRQAAFLIPMAVSVAYGLLIGSFFILMFLPIYVIYLGKVRIGVKWLFTGKTSSAEELEPAIIERKNIKHLSEENVETYQDRENE